MECCDTTQLWLRLRPLCPAGHGPPSRPIRGLGGKSGSTPSQSDVAPSHSTSENRFRNPPTSPVLDARRNVLRTGTADHQLPHRRDSAFDPPVTSSSGANGHVLNKLPRSNKCGGSESRHNVTLIVPIHPAIAPHRLLDIPAVENANRPVSSLLQRFRQGISDAEKDCKRTEHRETEACPPLA